MADELLNMMGGYTPEASQADYVRRRDRVNNPMYEVIYESMTGHRPRAVSMPRRQHVPQKMDENIANGISIYGTMSKRHSQFKDSFGGWLVDFPGQAMARLGRAAPDFSRAVGKQIEDVPIIGALADDFANAPEMGQFYIDTIGDVQKYIRTMEGSRSSDQDRAYLKRLFPEPGDSAEMIRHKIKETQSFAANKIARTFRTLRSRYHVPIEDLYGQSGGQAAYDFYMGKLREDEKQYLPEFLPSPEEVSAARADMEEQGTSIGDTWADSASNENELEY